MKVRSFAAILLLGISSGTVPASAQANLALGKNASESDSGWGGGSNKQEITDGVTTYANWAHGLAFTGGNNNWGGQPAGPRQATIDFGTAVPFNQVILWHRGDDHIPVTTWFDYWNGSNWTNITSLTRILGGVSEGPTTWAHSLRDEYDFGTVSGSKVRYRFDNSLPNTSGQGDYHGWLYEFEAYNVPEPSSLLLLIAGFGCLTPALLRRRRA